MRYYVKDSTLVIEGDFEAVSTGLNGGRARVNHLFNKQVPRTFNPPDPREFVKEEALKLGLETANFGLLTAVKMEYLQVVEDDYLTAFITAGVSNGSEFRAKVGTINIILISKARLSETALFGAIITATEAKGLALLEKGYTFLGTNTDAVIVAYEKGSSGSDPGNQEHQEIPYAGSSTEFGKQITEAVMRGVKVGLELRGE
ncbi:adenosylcobinamide amidohydrolase [Methanosarcina sp. 2.H.T.1A.6]|uniref:adenosylcobinamide amidohydrolase n=1 Tax=unclassified Methanosarcina TaxID=2644672 RepID=UPI00062145D9|nr:MULTISPECIES: adenosylcobinamide amidohydrolase [unclassified Methanosarcina]KKG16679.1 adenosylcobinamide amidohydrolase [Methanosarcina sp. 2.H.T.1A.3]KKG21540.1 adenosylcobinamide amidohydrolase [Methanosarcina sp. 2.H.T.1A.6]KKG21601.1 adenosylcobinamide amidohydrolase [Methanosarcina sp. 2.H.T.1A.8]KKG26197.1 adenosylcobinamide amidohydrolase [Methanosarcina sp. 2.H.T.1A.15]